MIDDRNSKIEGQVLNIEFIYTVVCNLRALKNLRFVVARSASGEAIPDEDCFTATELAMTVMGFFNGLNFKFHLLTPISLCEQKIRKLWYNIL